jgi:CheY-like chemotaxis protein
VPESKAILLVEDSPDDVFLTRMAYEQAGITDRLVVVSNGEQAVQYLTSEGPYADRNFQFPDSSCLIWACLA